MANLSKFPTVAAMLVARGAAAVAAAAAAAAASSSSTYRNNDAILSPSMGHKWISVGPGMEFQPSDLVARDPALQNYVHRMLVSHSGSHSGYENEFLDGSGTYYNDYSQAWRLLGFYTDCNAPHNNWNECSDNDGGGDGGDNENNEAACQRYLMWAAYIDLDYSGGGIGEYQFFDRHAQSWDKTSCRAENGRCAKMDCHMKDTHFKLLGIFKEPNYHEWMEQLFKHQGVCLWTNDEYNFMQTDRYLWPCDCTSTGKSDEDGNTLYYDTKPMPEGRIGLGLYTDARCKFEYTGSMAILDVLPNDASAYSLEVGLEKWNDAFDVFKVCQPCKAYNLGYNTDLNNGGGDRQGGDQDEGYAFSCYDDADYLNVNQCMKYATKTEMLAADFRDMMLAHQQGNTVEFEVLGKTYGYGGYGRGRELQTSFTMSGRSGIPAKTITFFTISVAFLIASACLFWKARKAGISAPSSKYLKEPLMVSKPNVSGQGGVMI